jgi:hypothetical protein
VTNETATDIRLHSARMKRFVSALWLVCLVLVLLERFSAAGLQLFMTDYAARSVRAFACQCVAAIPEVLYLLGLWWVRDALAAFARGELFALPMTRMLGRVGAILAVGSGVRIFIVPGVCRLLGFDPGHWIAFDAAGLVLGGIGLALRAIGGVLRHAASVQAELDEIF